VVVAGEVALEAAHSLDEWDDHLEAVRRAPVAKVNDVRAKRLRLDQLQVDPFVQGGEVGRAAAE